MELRNLGNCGLRVSALSLGAMTFGESQTFMKGVDWGYPYSFIERMQPG